MEKGEYRGDGLCHRLRRGRLLVFVEGVGAVFSRYLPEYDSVVGESLVDVHCTINYNILLPGKSNLVCRVVILYCITYSLSSI
jgi:hypothetical protein